MSGAEFYLQDSRSYVGNDMLFWAKGGHGYTTDVSKAQTYTAAEVQSMHRSRPTDIPWPKPDIDAKTRPAVDMQYIKRDEALQAEVTRTGALAAIAERDAARGKWMIANATWSRHGNGVVNNVTEMIIRVADGADLSCKAMREAAIDAAMKGEAP